MRYKLNADGYVVSVAFGCYLDGSAEYEGEVPIGYNTLDDWATYSCIQAYYIDGNGNLTLDQERLAECRRKEAQDKVDNEPLLRKDLYGSEAVLDSQYIKATEKGEVIVLEDIKTIAPRVKITGIKPYSYTSLVINTQGKNMMPCNAISQTIADVVFTVNMSGSITAKGTATEDIEYLVGGGLFALKKLHDYYLNLGGLDCELRYFDGETTAQQYIGASGLLNLPEDIKVNQVVIKIANGTTVDTTFYPQLEYGNVFTSYEAYKCKSLEIDFTEHIPTLLVPSNTLYPSDNLYPSGMSVDYIRIEQGVIYICVYGVEKVIGTGNIGLYGSYNTIYSTENATLEIEYSTNVYDVESLEFLQGKATTTNKFKILEDGSIEATNGYFSGKIEADDGYFNGSINSNDVNITGGSISLTGNETLPKFTIKDNNGSYCFFYPSGFRYYDADGQLLVAMHRSTGLALYQYYNGEMASMSGISSSIITTKGSMHAQRISLNTDGVMYAIPLYVNGDAEIKGTTTLASSPVISSDRNLKDEIAELDAQKTSDFIYSLKPCEFKYKDGTSNRLHHGFIAQEVKESMGEDDWGIFVSDKETEHKGIRYEELIADLVATVQTQNKRIEQLEKMVKEIDYEL